jgi:UDP-N-acetylmuramoyl-tripeptide--D-alanyl-D-alanine ligase
MTPLWTSREIAAACGGQASADFAVNGVEFDSRAVQPGALFVALSGESTDGHRYVAQALANGAAGALISQPVEGPHVLVGDTFAALQALGLAARLRASSATRIAVTGSVGKTSVKEAIRLALDRYRYGLTHASVKSFNNHVGVPLTLARMPANVLFGVFEMGMNHAGEIAALTRQVAPHVAVITTIGTAHLENLGSVEGIADAKAEILEGLVPGGTAILPADSAHFARLMAHAERLGVSQVLRFSTTDSSADVHLVQAVQSPACTTMTANVCGDRLSFRIGQPGAHWVSNALAVLAAVKAAGGDLGLAGLAMAEMQPLKGRGRRSLVSAAGGQAVLIDESYNANPASMIAALAVLGGIEKRGLGRHIAVLGEMRELGPDGPQLHADLAPAVKDAGVDHLLLVGSAMKPLGAALSHGPEVEYYADAPRALERLQGLLRSDDVVLVKGSNSVGLGHIVEVLAQAGGNA